MTQLSPAAVDEVLADDALVLVCRDASPHRPHREPSPGHLPPVSSGNRRGDEAAREKETPPLSAGHQPLWRQLAEQFQELEKQQVRMRALLEQARQQDVR